MKAVYATGTNYDDPLSVLEVGTMPEPETKPFWSTIRVNSASVNHHDVWSLQGVGLSDEQTPMILGTDAAGVLEEDIPVRKGLKAGSEVVLYTFVGTDGAGVMPGERRSILSERYAGTMSEYTQVPSANVFAKPANLTLDEAAALGTSWLTAYSLLFTSANVKPGDTVLVQGAGGGVSTAAIQLAHAAGLEVFVTSRSEEKRDRAIAIGADAAFETALRTTYASALVNGPFSVILGSSEGLLAINDRLKLRALMAAEKGSMVYMASEQAAIELVCPDAENMRAIGGGEPFVVQLDSVVAAKAAADADAENDPHNAPLAHEVGVLPRRKEA